MPICRSGRHRLQIAGPTKLSDRARRTINPRPAILISSSAAARENGVSEARRGPAGISQNDPRDVRLRGLGYRAFALKNSADIAGTG